MTDERDFSVGIPVDDLDEGQILGGIYEGEKVVLVRHGGRVCAFAGLCSHLKAPLAKGILADGQIRCPWHHARFDATTGEAVGAPAFRPLARFDVLETDGRIRVTGKADDPVAVPVASDIGRVVIVGSGAAGHACADILARAGAGGSVTVLSADDDPPYDRTFCSKQYLAGKVDRDMAMLPEPGLGRGPRPTIRTGVRVTGIDTQGRTLQTSDGDTVPYDRLVLATGAEPIQPDFDGSDRADVFVLRSLADADAVIEAAADKAAAVVLGSSYVGLEVAAALIQRGLRVTVVSQGEIPLERTAGPEVGRLIRDLHKGKGVMFHMGRKVTAWNGRNAKLDDGSTVEGGLMVAGIGVSPRLELARDAGLTIADNDAGGGVLVDGFLRSSVPAIHAIGDIASVPDPRLGHPIRVEHWVVAQRMGQWLARYILGTTDAPYAEVPFFWSGHYGTSLRYVGHVGSPENRRIEGDVQDRDFAVTFAEDGQAQAILTCGRNVVSLQAEARWDR